MFWSKIRQDDWWFIRMLSMFQFEWNMLFGLKQISEVKAMALKASDPNSEPFFSSKDYCSGIQNGWFIQSWISQVQQLRFDQFFGSALESQSPLPPVARCASTIWGLDWWCGSTCLPCDTRGVWFFAGDIDHMMSWFTDSIVIVCMFNLAAGGYIPEIYNWQSFTTTILQMGFEYAQYVEDACDSTATLSVWGCSSRNKTSW